MKKTNIAEKNNVVKLEKKNEELTYAFPEADPMVRPTGEKVLVQFRRRRNISKGGVIIPESGKQAEEANNMVAKVIAVGPLAFKYKTPDKDGKFPEYGEGAWCKPGDFVRVPKYGGDRWRLPDPKDEHDNIGFGIIKDNEIIGVITGDPMALNSYYI